VAWITALCRSFLALFAYGVWRFGIQVYLLLFTAWKEQEKEDAAL
jgi:hypothetical protein